MRKNKFLVLGMDICLRFRYEEEHKEQLLWQMYIKLRRAIYGVEFCVH